MSEIVDFLLARLAEDHEVMERAIKSYQHVFGIPHYFDPRPGEFPSSMVGMTPYAARAEVEAKRRIVELHKPTEEIVEWFDAPETGRAAVCPSCHPAEPTPWNPPVGKAGIRPPGFVAAYVLAPCPTLRLLALPYADHPGYRQEWRP